MAYLLNFNGREIYGIGKKFYPICGLFFFDEFLHLVIKIESDEYLFDKKIKTEIEGHEIVFYSETKLKEIDGVKVEYDQNGKIIRIGEAEIVYSQEERIVRIGKFDIQYYPNGRIGKIGKDVLTYKFDGQILSIGGKDYNFL